MKKYKKISLISNRKFNKIILNFKTKKRKKQEFDKLGTKKGSKSVGCKSIRNDLTFNKNKSKNKIDSIFKI